MKGEEKKTGRGRWGMTEGVVVVNDRLGEQTKQVGEQLRHIGGEAMRQGSKEGKHRGLEKGRQVRKGSGKGEGWRVKEERALGSLIPRFSCLHQINVNMTLRRNRLASPSL